MVDSPIGGSVGGTSESMPYTSALDRTISFFYELAGDNRDLSSRLYHAGHDPVAWVTIASSAGYEFSQDDLREVAEELLQRPVGRDSSVQELVAGILSANEDEIRLSPEGVDRLKAVMQQGRFSGYYRPW